MCVWYVKVSGNTLQAVPVPPPGNKITCPSNRTGTAHNPAITATFEALRANGRIQNKQTPGLCPRVNYTDRGTAACRQSQLLPIEGVAWSAQRIHTAVISVSYTEAATFSPKWHTFTFTFICVAALPLGARGSVVVKALCYKPDGRGFDTR
jgi:hypothetical protein